MEFKKIPPGSGKRGKDITAGGRGERGEAGRRMI